MALIYRWLANRYRKSIVDVVEEEVAGAAATDPALRYMNGIIHPSFHLEGKNLKSNFNFVKNILEQGMINDVNEVLPSDLWVEILRRIPAADLFPLKAVSKTFYRLISDDLFARVHLNDFIKFHPNAKRAILSTDKTHPPISHLNYYDPEKGTITESRFNDWGSHAPSIAFGSRSTRISRDRLIDSYHGLLLLLFCNRLFLCNPITRSYRFLTSEFLPSLEFGFWKIAYDNVSKKYKVFCLSCPSRPEVVWLDVFDVRRDKELQSPRETTIQVDHSQISMYKLIKESVLVNDNVHWLINTEKDKVVTSIISVNVTTEEAKTRNCSFTEPFIWSRHDNFFAANGKFYLGRSFFPDGIKLWVLEGVESENPNPSWMIKHRVASTLTLSTWDVTRVLGMFHDKVLMINLRQYDMTSEEFEEVTVANGSNNIECKMSNVKSKARSCRIIEHIDSLICL